MSGGSDMLMILVVGKLYNKLVSKLPFCVNDAEDLRYSPRKTS